MHSRELAVPFVCAVAVLLLVSTGFASAVSSQDETARRVDAIFAQWDRDDSPGCALGVYRDGAILYSRGYGMADLERHVRITPKTVFDIGSTSKQFTAAAVVLLEQDGKLTLDDDVRKWIPELPSYGKPVTIRHMLHHTSGLRDYIGLLTLAGAQIDGITDADDALRMIARQKELNFDPGAQHLYSNSGYFLLSVIVERASGKTLQEFARERIFVPLGMTRTHYMKSYDDIVPDRALAYAPRMEGGLRLDVSRWTQVGDGAVFTTVEELLRWDNNFYDPNVGGRALVDALQAVGRTSDGKALDYALGLGIGTYRGQPTVSHGGSWGGYRAELLRFPAQRFSVATLCNLATSNPTRLARRVADVYLEKVLAPEETPAAGDTPAAKIAAGTLSAYAGIYRNSATRNRMMFNLVEGVLNVASGDGRVALQPRSETVFGAAGFPATWTFEAAAGGKPARVTLQREGRDAEVFEKIAPLKLSADELAPYAGPFYSGELDATFTLAVGNGALMLRRRGAGPQRLVPLVQDEFMAGGAVTIRFIRGPSGTVTGYLLDMGRIRNLRFERR